jgi:hypothetical protein
MSVFSQVWFQVWFQVWRWFRNQAMRMLKNRNLPAGMIRASTMGFLHLKGPIVKGFPSGGQAAQAFRK